MLRNIFFYSLFGILLVPAYLVLVISVLFFRMIRNKEKEMLFLRNFSGVYFRFLMDATGSRVKVKGLENLPDPSGNSICLVSNHQSYFDILLIEAYVPFLVGFVAKKELGNLPILNRWMKELGCVLIDRSSPKSAVEAIDKGVESIRNGNPLVLFPEGTRSRSQQMNTIKPGSLKLATRAEALIVPVTINYSYKVYEAQSRVASADISVVFHKPIDTKLEENKNSRKLADKIQKMIKGSLL